MNRHPVYRQTATTLYDVDYSYYLQRGRQEQARALRAMFAGLIRWFRQRLPVRADRRDAGRRTPLAEPVSHCS